jgi:predicted nucleic-acid-binding Zn-ribbon protein
MSKEFVGNCPYCGSSNIGSSEKEIKCFGCGMGKYKDVKHKT